MTLISTRREIHSLRLALCLAICLKVSWGIKKNKIYYFCAWEKGACVCLYRSVLEIHVFLHKMHEETKSDKLNSKILYCLDLCKGSLSERPQARKSELTRVEEENKFIGKFSHSISQFLIEICSILCWAKRKYLNNVFCSNY